MTQDQAPPSDRSPLEGLVLDLTQETNRPAVLDQALNYRGDVTLHLTDGSTLEGYIFDRRTEGSTAVVRLILKETGRKHSLPLERIAKIAFTGRDTAAGRSWESWVKNYLEKRAKGEKASIEAESLD